MTKLARKNRSAPDAGETIHDHTRSAFRFGTPGMLDSLGTPGKLGALGKLGKPLLALLSRSAWRRIATLLSLLMTVILATPAEGQLIDWRMRDFLTARYDHAMAYDSARHVTVLFGGTTSSSEASAETWEWDGITWSQRHVTGPSPRSGHAMAYDASRGVTVLFGGYTSA